MDVLIFTGLFLLGAVVLVALFGAAAKASRAIRNRRKDGE